MKINIAEKYENNIVKKFHHNSFKSSTELSDKEKVMWTFTLWLLKDNWPKVVFDTKADRFYLSSYLSTFLTMDWSTKFTLDEWANYLSSK